MSKRETADLMKDGYSIYLKDLENLGYTPEGVVNWIALMGWSLDDRTEFFTMNDLIEKFSLDRLNPAPAAINFSKLDHFNGLHIRNLDNEELARRVEPYLTRCGYRIDDQVLQKAIPIIKERLVSLDEAPDWVGFFFQEQVSPDFEQLIPKHMDATSTAGMLRKALAIVSTIPDFSAKTLEYSLRKLVEEEGLSVGQLFGALRIAITGQKVSPPLFESMEIVGRKLVVDRIQAAIIQLEGG
jgi:glutamyl-tRNA synthetase